jgi:ATP-dependent helicase/nuclease subunit B
VSISGPFDRAGPRWFTIPAHRPFVEDLARGLSLALAPLGPEALSQAIVLTPTRRGARALAEAFLTVSGGKAVLLPQVRTLGDLDEGEPPFEPGDIGLDLPPAVTGYRRRFELARLVSENAHIFRRTIDAAGAVELADALAGFLDSLQIEEVSAQGKIETLVEGDFAEHWKHSAQFLSLALEAWPRRLKALGLMDVAERRVALLRLLQRQWTDSPPSAPLIAAGSTGTAPATADLLAAIAAAPLGAVVLPGLDLELADKAWADVGEQHPQGAMKRLLDRHGLTRADVAEWPAGVAGSQARGRWRRRIVNEALRPADQTADWRDQIARIREEAEDGDPVAIGLEGLTVIAGRGEEDSASVAALLLREALETPGKTAALVTPDRDLARRVSAKLARWGVGADSSAGAPLSHCPVGVLIGLIARAAIDPCSPVRLLAILKHPLVRLGLEDRAREAALAALENDGLRGPRPGDWEALAAKLKKKNDPGAADLLLRARAALDRVAPTPERVTAAAQARALTEAVEALALGEDGGLGGLWAGPSGESAGQLLTALMTESEGLPEVTPTGFAQLIEKLMAGATVRMGGAAHPRLRILGAIEARLVRADRLILAGLEEGVWPQGAPIDPFLSRPMRAALGLPPPERRVGLSAHDFAQAACAPEVFLLHSERREGAPAVESRWLWRLKTLAKGAGVALPQRPEALAWARALDAPGGYSPAPRAEFAPPLDARPKKLAVTQVEALTRDPYAVYARNVLRLYPLDRPDEPMEQRARGTAIHEAFERFAGEWAGLKPQDAGQRFADLYLEELRAHGAPASAMARESALAAEAGAWIAEMELRRRADGARVIVEQSGQASFKTGRGEFTVTAKADRIELTKDGFAHVLDFKTGPEPSNKQVDSGFSPQLTLTAAIIARGGFEGIGPRPPGDLTYIRITGRSPAGTEVVSKAAGAESHEAAEVAFSGLQALITRYEDPAYPYRSRTAPQFVKTYASDYDHLARVYEWSTSDDDGDGE